MTETNPITGEVTEDIGMELVPLNLAALSEDELLEMFPTPMQAMGALIHARSTNARAPHALNAYRAKLRTAENAMRVTLAKVVRDLADEYPRANMTERRMLAHADERMIAAQDALDTAWLLYEFARDYAKAIAQDIEVLRSINANLRPEHR